MTSLSAEQILKVPLDRPEHLFIHGDVDKVKKTYRTLMQTWHPDHNSDARASSVVAHINLLYEKAQQKLAAGVWDQPGVLRFTGESGVQYQMVYKKDRPFELGTVYIGDRIVVYSFRPEYTDLADNARGMIMHFRFANDEMRAEAKRYLPEYENLLTGSTGHTYLVLRKAPEYLCLRDIVAHMSDRLEPRHVAWVMSRLHNLLCYFQWAGLTHNDISIDNYFISPANHTGCLVGGWWYAAPVGRKMLALPARTLRYAPQYIVDKKLADPRIDSELVRAVGRELLGDPVGSKAAMMKDVPQPMLDWLRLPGSASALEEYQTWYNTVLPKAFGPRRFVRMEVPSGLYD
jgi:hypothetical protein